MAIGDKVYIADKPTLDEVKSKMGTTTDTGGTTTAGGIFAKLNAILQQFMSNWTAVRAVKLDNLDVAVSSRASAEDLKKINSNLVKPLDTLMNEITSSTRDRIFEINNLVNTLKTGTIPIVKSIQRGIIEDTSLANDNYLDIIVSYVNVNKSVLSACSTDYFDLNCSYAPRYEVINGTTIRIYYTYKLRTGETFDTRIKNLSWQLTEFY